MKSFFLLALPFVLCAGLWADEVFTYRVQRDKEIGTIMMTVTQTDDGRTVRESQDRGNEERTAEIDSRNSTSAFHFRNVSAGTDYEAQRAGGKISVTGMLNNRALKREFSVNAEPWYQFPEQALGSVPPFTQAGTKFWLIDAEECEIHEIEAVPAGMESISLMGAPVQARKIKVSPTGFASLFWSALYWFGPAEEPYLRYETTEGPLRGPRLLIEVVSRESHHE